MVTPAVVKAPKVKKPVRVNHRKEKYLKRQVRRLRIHPHVINAKRRKREAVTKIENIVLATLEKCNGIRQDQAG